MGRNIHSKSSALKQLKNTAVFSLNGFRYQHELKRLIALFDSDVLKPLLNEFPAILEKPFKPYVCADWEMQTRVEQIESHFRFIAETFGDNAVEIYKLSGYELFHFDTKDENTYRVELFQGFQNEGAIGVRLCDSEQREVYTLTFHISNDPAPMIVVGAIQGPNDLIPDRQQTITQLTRSLHGLRPKSLMIEVLYMVARQIGIDTIYGVSNAGHIHQSDYFSDAKRSLMLFDLDALWGEYFAQRKSESLFQLPQRIVRKDIMELKSKKRSLYRKRYAWLDEVEERTAEAMQALMQSPITTQLLPENQPGKAA